MTTRRSLTTLALVGLILVVVVAALYVTRAQTPQPTALSTPTPTVTATATATALTTTPPPSPTALATASPQVGGSITGRFGYGSDFIPPVVVYAISTTDPRVWYSVPFAGFGNPPRPTLPPGQTEPRYTITGVAPGTYWVVAYRTDTGQGPVPDPGFYSRQTVCFRATPSGPCPDVGPAMVTVAAGQTTSGVDIITWGTFPQPSPTLPPRPTTR